MMKKLNKLGALLGAAILSFGLLTTGCGTTANDSNDTEKEAVKDTTAADSDSEDGSNEESKTKDLVIRSSLFVSVAYDNQLWLAEKLGLWDEEFADDNIKIEFSEFTNGPAVNEALLADEVDIENAVGDQPMIAGIAAGTESVAVAGLSRQSVTQGVYTLADSDIQSAKDLKGKKVSVGIGTFTHKCLIGVLEDAGYTEDDVELVNLTDQTESISALQSGEIDALVSNFSALYDLLQDGTVKQVADFSSHPAYTYLVIKQRFIDEYPDVVQRIVNVLVRVQKYEEQHPDEVAELVSEQTGHSVEAVKQLRSQIDLTIDINDEDKKQIQYTYDFMESHDLLTEPIDDITTVYDDTFVKKAIETVANE